MHHAREYQFADARGDGPSEPRSAGSAGGNAAASGAERVARGKLDVARGDR